MRGLRYNFPEVELHLLEFKPDFLFLSETDINASIQLNELTVPNYSLLIVKHDQLNNHGHGLGAYIKGGFPCGRQY